MPSPLAALSPLDGRYARTADPLRQYFSEQGLIRTRVRVELAWLEALAAEKSIREIKPFSPATRKAFARLVKEFSERDAEHIKNIEAETNHDVKAIEYWLKAKLGKNAEVQAKWMNSSERCASALFPSFALSQYSMAFTSWLVSASMFLMCSASRSEKPLTSLSKAESVWRENGRTSLVARSAASACSQASSMRTR